MAHATEADLTAWLEGSGLAVPADAERQLERASLLVDRATVAAVYDTDEAGTATDQDVLDALSDATCAQVEWWIETGDELGRTAGLTSAGIGSVNLSWGGPGDSTGGSTSRLADRAVDVLVVAGLTPKVGVGA